MEVHFSDRSLRFREATSSPRFSGKAGPADSRPHPSDLREGAAPVGGRQVPVGEYISRPPSIPFSFTQIKHRHIQKRSTDSKDKSPEAMLEKAHVVTFFEGGRSRSVHGVIAHHPKIAEGLERRGYSAVTLDGGRRAYVNPRDYVFLQEKNPGRY